jgi:hypothetical protein
MPDLSRYMGGYYPLAVSATRVLEPLDNPFAPACPARVNANLTVYYALVRQIGQRFHHVREAACEILLIARPELSGASGLVIRIIELSCSGVPRFRERGNVRRGSGE